MHFTESGRTKLLQTEDEKKDSTLLLVVVVVVVVVVVAVAVAVAVAVVVVVVVVKVCTFDMTTHFTCIEIFSHHIAPLKHL